MTDPTTLPDPTPHTAKGLVTKISLAAALLEPMLDAGATVETPFPEETARMWRRIADKLDRAEVRAKEAA